MESHLFSRTWFFTRYNEFIKCFLQFDPWMFLSLSNWKRKQISYRSRTVFFSKLSGWNRNHKKSLQKYIPRFGIRDWSDEFVNKVWVIEKVTMLTWALWLYCWVLANSNIILQISHVKAFKMRSTIGDCLLIASKVIHEKITFHGFTSFCQFVNF